MSRDDAMLAFERHATSKLRDVKDLLSIATLGFRGEALPSIASVSRLLLETRSPEETTGARVEIAGGKMLRCEEAALPPGTSITVRDLFFNVPARKKFLRSEPTELAHIASLATHYSLAHPGKTFQLTSGANDLLHVTPVATLRERVYQVFGSQTLDELVDLGACERELILPPVSVPPSEAIAEFRREPDEPPSRAFRLTGFISRPQVQKSNRNSIFTFVNGRLIRDRLLLHAISSAYHNLMPHSCYPFALVFLECDCEEVDVNVHPSKTEVRFRHGSFVHDFVRDTIRDRLIETRPAPAFTVASTGQPAPQLPYSEFTQMLENEAGAEDADLPAGQAAQGQPALNHAQLNYAQLNQVQLHQAQSHQALPEFALRPEQSPPPRFDFGTGAVAVGPAHLVDATSAGAPLAKSRIRWQSRASPNRTASFRQACCRRFRPRSLRSPICARWARFTRVSSSPQGATGCGSSTSTWLMSVSCSKKY
jgi:DNA mismatch repair protein MutL